MKLVSHIISHDMSYLKLCTLLVDYCLYFATSISWRGANSTIALGHCGQLSMGILLS